jgi:hypothetical protein
LRSAKSFFAAWEKKSSRVCLGKSTENSNARPSVSRRKTKTKRREDSFFFREKEKAIFPIPPPSVFRRAAQSRVSRNAEIDV